MQFYSKIVYYLRLRVKNISFILQTFIYFYYITVLLFKVKTYTFNFYSKNKEKSWIYQIKS